MNAVLLLLKKDYRERYSSVFKRDKAHKDLFGVISTFILLAILYATFVFVFSRFASSYLGAVFGEPDTEGVKRVYELSAMVYVAVLILNTLVGVKKIQTSLSDGKDAEVLLCQPISATQLFIYKLLKIYFAQILSTALVLIPSAMVLQVKSPYAGGVWYNIATFLQVFTLPFLSCALSTLIALPFSSLMRFVERKFVLHLILYVIVIAVMFLLYGRFLKVLSALLNTGEINYVFNRTVVYKITTFVSYAYPANLLSNILFGKKLLLSILLILLISLVSAAVTYLIIRAVFIKSLQLKMEGETKFYRRKKVKNTQKNPLFSLMCKEFIVILRTPTYAFQYFATVFTLPLMVYVLVNLMRSMVSALTVINCDFEIAVFVIAMFSVLTNTFCTSNISRDGKMLGMLKTLPIKGSTVVFGKVIFCMATSLVSIIASIVVLGAAGYLNLWQCAIIFIAASMLSFSEVAFSTRKDLNNPALPQNDKEIVEEGSRTVSEVVFIGLIASLLCGAGSLAISAILGLIYSLSTVIWASVGFVMTVVTVVFVLSLFYLKKGLEQKFYETEL